MKALIFGMFLAVTPAVALSQDGETRVTAAPSLSSAEMRDAVAFIESHIQLPNGAGSLDDYDRYYAQRYGVIVALYAGPRLDDSRGPHFVRILDNADELPMVFDGGCSFIDVGYAPETRQVTARCHGEA